MSQIRESRRQFLKATAITAGVATPLLAKADGTIPPIISLLLESPIRLSGTAVLEGEGSGGQPPFFPDNSIAVSRGSNTVDMFYKRFRPDFDNSPDEDLGFDEITVQLSPAAEQSVTLTVSVVAGSTLMVDTASQTVMSDASGLATFAKVKIPESSFGFGENLLTEDHTFELRFSTDNADDFVSLVRLDLSAVARSDGFTLEGEGNGSVQRQFFGGEGQKTQNDFYDRFRPDFTASGSSPVAVKRLGISSPSATLTPESDTMVTLTAEMIAGGDIDVLESSKVQNKMSSFGFVSFDKIFFTPEEFGPAGSEDLVVTANHTVRLTYSATGFTSSVVELTLDLESPPE